MARVFRLERTGMVDLQFEGEVIANITSRLDDNAPRWTEYRIFRAISGKYVVEVVGMTTYPSERERREVSVVNSPEEVVATLHRQGAKGAYLTKTALDALDEAAENDPSFHPVITERL